MEPALVDRSTNRANASSLSKHKPMESPQP